MLTIGPASGDEQAACLALLPEIRNMPAELIAAHRDGELVGAAAIIWESWADPAGFPISVHVIPSARRLGIGRALVEAALALVDGETDGLWALGKIDEAGAAADFLRACGFVPLKRTLHFEMDGQTFYDHASRIVDRLRRHGRIPHTARTIALRDARLDDVAWLVSREFPSGPVQLLSRMHQALAAGGSGGGIDMERSTVVMEGDQIVGALLYRWNDGNPIIEANVVAPQWRKTYVNALQLQVATDRGLEGGASSFRFDTEIETQDSMNLARRGGGRQIAAEARFYRAAAAG